METPYLTHITPDDYNYVYEPAEDSFLLLDAIEADLPALISDSPIAVCVEIGTGSGIIISATAKVLRQTACFGIDINPRACLVTQKTAAANNASLDVVNMNLLNGFRAKVVDLLIFNPPYVVTSNDELNSGKLTGDNPFNDKIIQSWAGGIDGRVVMDRVFDAFDDILSENGRAYILVIEENKPHEIIDKMQRNGFDGEIVAERRIRGEHLFVLRFNRRLD